MSRRECTQDNFVCSNSSRYDAIHVSTFISYVLTGLAKVSSESRRARALKAVDDVTTGATIFARDVLAFVYVCYNVEANPLVIVYQAQIL